MYVHIQDRPRLGLDGLASHQLALAVMFY